jgi:hypothetical protein
VRTLAFDVVPTAFDPVEVVYLREHRWWSLSQIIEAMDHEKFVPRRIGELLPSIIEGKIPPEPVDTGP